MRRTWGRRGWLGTSAHNRGRAGCCEANPTRREPMVAQTNAAVVDAYMKGAVKLGSAPARYSCHARNDD